jgi:hypothetical protein
VCGLVCLGATIRADVPLRTQQEITAIYRKMEQAFKSRDAAGLTGVMDDTYEVVFPNGGKVDHTRIVASYGRQMSAIQEVHSVHMLPETWTDGNSHHDAQGPLVVVSVTNNFTAKTLDSQRAPHEISSVVHSRDTWHKVKSE